MSQLPLGIATESTPLVLPTPCGCRHSVTLGTLDTLTNARQFTVKIEQCPLHAHAEQLRDMLQKMLFQHGPRNREEETTDYQARKLIARTSRPQ